MKVINRQLKQRETTLPPPAIRIRRPTGIGSENNDENEYEMVMIGPGTSQQQMNGHVSFKL
jgi:hypothetical protein